MATQSMKKHKIHKYRRVMQGERPIYRCFHPGCRHFIGEEMIEGQYSICNRCEQEFIVTRSMLFPRKIVKLHCDDCTRATYNKKTGIVQKGTAEIQRPAPLPVEFDFVDDLIKDLIE